MPSRITATPRYGGGSGRKRQGPKAVLAISVHWYVPGTGVMVMTAPRTIHDFGGFPQELFDQQYPAPGAPEEARRIREWVGDPPIGMEKPFANHAHFLYKDVFSIPSGGSPDGTGQWPVPPTPNNNRTRLDSACLMVSFTVTLNSRSSEVRRSMKLDRDAIFHIPSPGGWGMMQGSNGVIDVNSTQHR